MAKDAPIARSDEGKAALFMKRRDSSDKILRDLNDYPTVGKDRQEQEQTKEPPEWASVKEVFSALVATELHWGLKQKKGQRWKAKHP